MTTSVGDGNTTEFWTDRWLHGRSVFELAPALQPFIRKRGWRRLTVRMALEDNAWVHYIVGGLDVVAAWQCMQLWQLLNDVVLTPGAPDQHTWSANSSGMFTTK